MVDWQRLIFTEIDTSKGFWIAALCWGSALLGAWMVFRAVFAALGIGPQCCGAKVGSWCLKLMMLVHHCFVGPLAFLAISEDAKLMDAFACMGCAGAAPGMIADQSGPLISAQALVPITVGYMLADLILFPYWNLSSSAMLENLLMVMHHVISILVWQMTISFDYCQRYVLVLLSYEITSIPLTVMWVLSTSGRKSSLLYKFTGLIFTASFVVLRMGAAVPQLRSMWYAVPWQLEWAEFFRPGVVPAQLPLGIFRAGTATLVIPHMLNLFWGIKVVKGFISVFIGGDKKKSAKATQ